MRAGPSGARPSPLPWLAACRDVMQTGQRPYALARAELAIDWGRPETGPPWPGLGQTA